MRRYALPLALPFTLLLAGCATVDLSNTAAYCTPDNAYRLGSQSRAYFGNCPRDVEPQFLAGLQRGRQVRPWAPQVEPYYQQMEQTEARLRTASTDGEREPLRSRLRDLEWWAVHLINNKATFHD